MTRNGLLVIGCLIALLAPAARAADPTAPASESGVLAAPAFEFGDPLAFLGEPDAPEAATFSYYHVLGASMRPRNSTATVAYDGLGCAHMSDTGFGTFPVTVPDGSLIKYVRLYYCDTNAGSDVTGWLTEYNPPGGGFTDLTSVGSGSSAGCGSVLSAELTYTVSNASALAVLVSNSAADRQYCGLRVAYYLPYIFRDGFGTGNPGRWSSYQP